VTTLDALQPFPDVLEVCLKSISVAVLHHHQPCLQMNVMGVGDLDVRAASMTARLETREGKGDQPTFYVPPKLRFSLHDWMGAHRMHRDPANRGLIDPYGCVCRHVCLLLGFCLYRCTNDLLVGLSAGDQYVLASR
jgi:hypothetical protein